MNSQISIDVDMLDQLPAKTLLKLVERSQQVKKWLALFQRTVNEYAALFRRLEELEIDVKFNTDDGDVCLSFTGDGDRFGQVWAELRRHGYKPTNRPKKGDVSFCCWFELEGYSRVWVSFSSSVCKRVQVGTKMVEQPVYETHCGEGLPEIEEIDPVPALPAPALDEIPF